LLILAVHSSTPVLGVACVQDSRVLKELELPPGRQHLENLARLIADLTRSLKIELADLHGFGVAVGPGSFSGIRIGLATVKGMAIALGKPVAGVSCLDILAWQVLEEADTGTAMIDAKRGEVYAASYEKVSGKIVLLDGPALIGRERLSELMERSHATVAIAGDVEKIPENSIPIRVARPSAAVCGLMACERLKQGDADETHSLHPLYIRRSDAEEKNKQRKGLA